jgi:hypothetical protein
MFVSFLIGWFLPLIGRHLVRIYKKYSFSQRIVDMWNSLPKQVIETKTVNTFKSQLNNHWKNLEIKFSSDVYRPEAMVKMYHLR